MKRKVLKVAILGSAAAAAAYFIAKHVCVEVCVVTKGKDGEDDTWEPLAKFFGEDKAEKDEKAQQDEDSKDGV